MLFLFLMSVYVVCSLYMCMSVWRTWTLCLVVKTQSEVFNHIFITIVKVPIVLSELLYRQPDILKIYTIVYKVIAMYQCIDVEYGCLNIVFIPAFYRNKLSLCDDNICSILKDNVIEDVIRICEVLRTTFFTRLSC